MRWTDLISGRSLVVPSHPIFQAAIDGLDRECDEIFSKAQPVPGTDGVFSDKSLENEAEMTDCFVRLQTLAKAWTTPGSRFYQSTYVRGFVLTALEDLRRLVYHPGRTKSGNWWEWEIGSAKALADTLLVFRDYLSDIELVDHCAAIDYFVPDPWFQQDGIESTGANRVDLCQAVIVRSLLTDDEARLRRAVAGLPATWSKVSSGDGFYADGSYIQHTTIPYTGTYGVVLLQGLSLLFALLAGSAYDIPNGQRSTIELAVEQTYAPFIWRGQMMDAVRGRAISRDGERSHRFGDDAIEAVLRLAREANPDRAARWKGLCKAWIEDARTGSMRHDILESANVVRAALVHDLMDSEIAPLRGAQTSRIFPCMDRLVHRAPDGEWVFALAMNSQRIAWYESGNGENNLGAQTSSGMTYLYVDGDEGHFDDDFWPTSDLSAPCGTTVALDPLPPRVEGEWGAKRPKNEWTGGVVDEGFSLAGQHMLAPGGSGLRARKTWFASDSYVVCLGADIGFDFGQSRAAQPSDRPTPARVSKTVVEHRNLGSHDARLIVDDQLVVNSRDVHTPTWAHLSAVAGYIFLAPATVRATIGERSGSWGRIDHAGSDAVLARRYATIEVKHTEAGDGSYAYVILPRASLKDTRAAADEPFVDVLANGRDVQAVSAGDVLAANFWRAGSVAGVTSDSPATVLIRRSSEGMHVSVSDPTHSGAHIVLDFADTTCIQVDGERANLTVQESAIRVTVDVAGLSGGAATFRLNAGGASE